LKILFEKFHTKNTKKEKITKGKRGGKTFFFLFFVFFVRTLLEKFSIGENTYKNIKFIQ